MDKKFSKHHRDNRSPNPEKNRTSQKNSDPKQKTSDASTGMLIASEIIAGPLVGTFLGIMLEKRWPALSPFGLIGGFILGVVAAFYTLIKKASRWEKSRHQR